MAERELTALILTIILFFVYRIPCVINIPLGILIILFSKRQIEFILIGLGYLLAGLSQLINKTLNKS